MTKQGGGTGAESKTSVTSEKHQPRWTRSCATRSALRYIIAA